MTDEAIILLPAEIIEKYGPDLRMGTLTITCLPQITDSNRHEIRATLCIEVEGREPFNVAARVESMGHQDL